jgi:hypothetical protein
MISSRLLVVGLVLAVLPVAAPGAAQDERLIEVLERLEMNIVTLHELGRHELAQMHERVAEEVRHRIERAGEERRGAREGQRRERERDRELQVMVEQLEILRMALPALREGERRDAAEAVGRAIRAREVVLEGRRDREAMMLRERSPNREHLRELLGLAANLYDEFGRHERADALRQAVEELWTRGRRAGDREREVAMHDLEVMEIATHAMLEAGREDSADLLRRAIQALRVRLEGHRGEEAQMVLEREPALGERVELMNFAAHLWREFGDHERADMCQELADRLARRWQERDVRERAHREGREHREDPEARERDRPREHADWAREMEALEAQIDELRRMLEAMRERMRESGGRVR